MSRESNGIHNPNKPPKPVKSDSEGLNDGQKALAYAGIGIALFTVNFGLPRALNNAADSIDAGGQFEDGMYFPNISPDYEPALPPYFKCNSDGNVIKIGNSPEEDELGEITGGILEKDNYGPQDGACDDGQLTPRDGDFWNSKVSEWGLLGMIYRSWTQSL